jgi:hypothetical protein
MLNTSMSIETVLPFNFTVKNCKSTWGWKKCPSNDLRVVGDWLSLGEPMDIHQDKDMKQVEDPSSKIVQWMFFPPTKI